LGVKTFFPERLAIKIINQKTDGEKGRPVITGRIKVRLKHLTCFTGI
jgi:hypothetical protein